MKEKLINGRESRYTIKCHYIGHSRIDFSIVYNGHSVLDAINHALESVNWLPIVFDTIIVEENIVGETIVGEIKIVKDNK